MMGEKLLSLNALRFVASVRSAVLSRLVRSVLAMYTVKTPSLEAFSWSPVPNSIHSLEEADSYLR